MSWPNAVARGGVSGGNEKEHVAGPCIGRCFENRRPIQPVAHGIAGAQVMRALPERDRQATGDQDEMMFKDL